MIHQITGNRTEPLSKALCDLLATPPAKAEAFEPEIVVVQQAAMADWLKLELARRNGICANVHFPFPRTFFDKCLVTLLSMLNGQQGFPSDDAIEATLQRYRRDTLTWWLMGILPTLLGESSFTPLRHYLHQFGMGGGKEQCLRRLYMLCHRIGSLFDDYIMYRPEMVLQWEEGQEEHWQARLWRSLMDKMGSVHLAKTVHRLASQLHTVQSRVSAGRLSLPARVCFFGINALPLTYIHLLHILCRLTEVYLFIISPSKEYLGFLDADRGETKLRAYQTAEADRADEEGDLEREVLNAHFLLGTMGKMGRDFAELQMEYLDRDIETSEELYDEPSEEGGTRSLLWALQSDILTMGQKGRDYCYVPGDCSMEIHNCHTKLREVEVLRDVLVKLFDADPTLTPSEVAITAPEWSTFQPFVESLLGFSQDGYPSFPLALPSEQSVTELLSLCEKAIRLMNSRLTIQEMLDFVAHPAVQKRFSLSDDDLAIIKTWVVQSGIRWGIDATHRESVDQPNDEQNTWRFGLKRLMLGMAMQCTQETLFLDAVRPYDEVEGLSTEILGRFVHFCETLFTYSEKFRGRKSAAEWAALVPQFFSSVLDSSFGASYQRLIRDTVQDVGDCAVGASFSEDIPLTVFWRGVYDRLQGVESARPHFNGGIMCGDMVALRGIPFKVLFILGMNESSFPRKTEPGGFNLIAASPKLGDRNPRDEDRYLFLEMIMQVRQKLIIMYEGRNLSDNSLIPASSVVEDLIDYIAATFSPPSRINVAASRRQCWTQVLVREHALNPFDPCYFKPDSALKSYSQSAFQTAQSLFSSESVPQLFIRSELKPKKEVEQTVHLSDFLKFFKNPAEYFIQRRLGIYLAAPEEELPSREPIELNQLEAYTIRKKLGEARLKSKPLHTLYKRFKAEGLLPLGKVGEKTFEQMQKSADILIKTLEPIVSERPCAPELVEFKAYGWTLKGQLADLYPKGQVMWYPGKLKSKVTLELWIRHLLLQLVGTKACTRSYLSAYKKDKKEEVQCISYEPVETGEAEQFLSQLMSLYIAGRNKPIPLFHNESEESAKKLKGSSSKDSVNLPNISHPHTFDTLLTRHWDIFKMIHNEHVKIIYGTQKKVSHWLDDYLTVAQQVFPPQYFEYKSTVNGFQ